MAYQAESFSLMSGLSRRALLWRSMAMGGAVIVPFASSGPAVAASPGPGAILPVTRAGRSVPGAQVEAVRMDWTDMGLAPARFAEDGVAPEPAIFFWWGFIKLARRRPILLLRVFTPTEAVALVHGETGARWYDPITPLSPPGYTGPAPWIRLVGGPENGSPDPFTWQAEFTGSPRMLYRTSSAGAHIVDGDFYDFTWRYNPYTMAIHKGGANAPYLQGAGVATGRYFGQRVTYSCGFDRFIGPDSIAEYQTAVPVYSLVYSGVHPDGRRESGAAYITGEKSAGIYWKEGCDPVATDDLEVEARYEVDPNDPQRVGPVEATFYYPTGQEIHYKAIYGVDYGLGGPGWTVRPVNTEGIWYERSSSRQFVHRMASLESHIHASSVDATPAS